MPFVQRNAEGRIVASSPTRVPGLFEEWVEDDDPELIAAFANTLVVELPDPNSVEERLKRLEQQVTDLQEE